MSFRTLFSISSMMVAVALFAASVGYTDHKGGHGKPGGKGDVDPQVTFEFFTCLEDQYGVCNIDTVIESDGGGSYTGKIFMSGSGDATISIIRSDRRIHITLPMRASALLLSNLMPGACADAGQAMMRGSALQRIFIRNILVEKLRDHVTPTIKNPLSEIDIRCILHRENAAWSMAFSTIAIHAELADHYI